MAQNTTRQSERVVRRRRKMKRWQKVVSSLACVVVFCTTYALILPAITMEQKACCGYAEHTSHSVEDGCYKEMESLICKKAEGDGHNHSDGCYQTNEILVCGKEEYAGHTHSSDCYTVREVLTCKQEENEEHTHDSGCYTQEKELTCKQEESSGHSHSGDCYKSETTLICGQEEQKAHKHGKECYETTRKLVCEKPLHTHTLACFSNSKADVETQSEWEKTMAKVKLTGHWDEDVLAIAESQKGYSESEKNYIVSEDGKKKGYTRYGAWYGDSYGDWCAMFASFCLNYADVDRKVMPIEANCQRWIEKLADEDFQLYRRAEGYTPKPGDLVFFDWDKVEKEENRHCDHVGLVSKLIYDKEKPEKLVRIQTIEGNSSDKVQYKEYEAGDTVIMGYGELPENPNPPAEDEDAQDDGESDPADQSGETSAESSEETEAEASAESSEEAENPEEVELPDSEEPIVEIPEEEEGLPRTELTYEGSDYTISISYTERAEIPEEAELSVREIKENSKEYEECIRKSEEALGINGEADENGLIQTITFARYFDITFLVEGEKIEPAAPVKVSISYKEAVEIPESDSAGVIHFAEDGTELIVVQTSQSEEAKTDSENAVDTFEFMQDSFSVTGTFVNTTSLPYGDYIIYTKYNGSYYALGTDGSAKPVTVNQGVVTYEGSPEDITWDYYAWNNSGSFIQTLDGEHLSLTANGVSTTGSATGTTLSYVYNDAGGFTARQGGYYLRLSNKERFTTTTSYFNATTIYFANNIEYTPEGGGTGDLSGGAIVGEVINGDKLEFGTYAIWTQVGNKYYALTKNCTWVEVTYDSATNTIRSATGGKDLLWEYNDWDTSNSGWVLESLSSRGKYLNTGTTGLLTQTNKQGIEWDYVQNKDGYRLKKAITTTSGGWWPTQTTTTYYPTVTSGGGNGSTTNANDAAVIHFAAVTVEQPYEKPVVTEHGTTQQEITGKFDHHKKIDYLADGADNPETDQLKEDLYRLYLDMTGMEKPVDLLIVVDSSSSMKDRGDTGDMRLTSGMGEIIKFLNGTVGDSYNHNVTTFTDTSCDGFIKEFFKLNNNNRLAITAFGGDVTTIGSRDGNRGYSSNKDFHYGIDTWLVKDWNEPGTPYNSVPVASGYFPDGRNGNSGLFIEDSNWRQGTDYCAALMYAQVMFDNLDKLDVPTDDRIRIMAFVSDGEPTYSVIQTTQNGYPSFDGYQYMRRGAGGFRWYADNDRSLMTGVTGVNDTYLETELMFERYRNAHPEVINYSIAFRVGSADDDVLEYMGSTDLARSNGIHFKSADNYTDINKMILGIFEPDHVVIHDTLTDYVSYYDAAPDLKVIMVPKNSSKDPETIWENGRCTKTYEYLYYDSSNKLKSETRNILKNVYYDSEAQTVVAEFDDDYALNPSYAYTLSFNVRSTDYSFDTYTTEGYNAVGEANTDYLQNQTSSGQEGFFSNEAAVVTYQVGDHRYEDGYEAPVIQVDQCDLKLIKLDNEEKPLTGATFELLRKETAENGQTGYEGVEFYTVNEDGVLTIPHEVLVTGDYKLVETEAPEGYLLSEEEITFTVARGMIEKEDLAEDSGWRWTKIAEKVGSGTNWPKNQFYHYELTLVNQPEIREQEIFIQKTDSSLAPLDGASFTLYRDVMEDDPKPENALYQTYSINGTPTILQIAPQAENLTSGTQTVTIDGEEREMDAVVYSGSLLEGTYYLVEEEAPPGYNKLKEPVVITVTSEGVSYTYLGEPIIYTVDDVDTVSSVQIVNTDGYTLPETGGAGTLPFTIGGTLMMSASLLYYGLSLRRKRERRMK